MLPIASANPLRRLVIGTTRLVPVASRRRVSSVARSVRVSPLSIRLQSRPKSKVASTSPAGSSPSGPLSVVWLTAVIVRRVAISNPPTALVGSGPSVGKVPASAAFSSAVESNGRSISVSVSLKDPSKVLVRRKALIGLVTEPAVEIVSDEERRSNGVSSPKVRSSPSSSGSSRSTTVLRPSRLRLSLRA